MRIPGYRGGGEGGESFLLVVTYRLAGYLQLSLLTYHPYVCVRARVCGMWCVCECVCVCF